MEKLKGFYLIVILLTSSFSFSQNSEEEDLYLKKLNEFTDTNNDSLLFYAKKLKETKNLCLYFIAANKEAKAHYQKGDFDLSKEESLLVLESTNKKEAYCFKKNKITALIRLFWIYKNQNQFQKAFDVVLERKEVIKSLQIKDNYYAANLISTEHNLAVIKSILGFNEETRVILKNILPKLPEIYKGLDKGDYFLKLNISSTLNIIGESYLETSTDNTTHLDSASFYFKKAFTVAKTFYNPHKNSETLYNLREARVLIAKKKFKEALDKIEKYDNKKHLFKIAQNISSLKAICFYQLKNNDSTLHYSREFLRRYAKKPNVKERLISIYDILANQYFKNKKLDSAYKYSELTLAEINILNKNKSEANKSNYLYNFKNAEALNTLIQKKEKTAKSNFILISILLLIFGSLVVYFLVKRNQKTAKNLSIITAEIDKKAKSKKTEYNIDEGLESKILDGINVLKNSPDFLASDFTIHSFAKKLDTNTSYLSYVINKEYHQSFKQYITELRIAYLIKKLKEDSKFRNYTIKSLAEEIGYTNASAFTRAFKKHIGITPSEFIKNLDDL